LVTISLRIGKDEIGSRVAILQVQITAADRSVTVGGKNLHCPLGTFEVIPAKFDVNDWPAAPEEGARALQDVSLVSFGIDFQQPNVTPV